MDNARTIVSRYGMEGWIEDFSSGLNTGRWGHGCTSFLSGDSERVKISLFVVNKTLKTSKILLVTGGLVATLEYLASTEVYRPSAGKWREVPGGALPRPMATVRLVTLNNRVFLFGGKEIISNR